MDEKFLKERARLIRDLADKADPFIKRRLTELANSYDARLKGPSRSLRTHPLLDSLQAKSGF
jgi:hypothetical protein